MPLFSVMLGRKARSLARVGCAILALVMGSGSLLASGVDDLQSAISAETHGERSVAMRFYTKAIESGELSTQQLFTAFNGRGLLYKNNGRFDLALEDFDQAVRLRPEAAEARVNRGLVFLFKREVYRAIEDYDEAIRLDPGQARAFHNRGFAYRQLGQYEKAIQDYGVAIRLNPQSPESFTNRGAVYYQLGASERAIEDFDQAIRLKPTYVDAYVHRGVAYRVKGEYELAIDSYNQAIQLQSSNAYARIQRGIAYGNLAQYGRAADDFQTALSIRFNLFAALHLFLARERAGQNGGDELLQRTRKLNPKTWPGVLAQHLTKRTSEDAVLAAIDRQNATRRQELECHAFYYIGMRRMLDGDQKGAAEMFRKTLATKVTDAHEYQQAKVELERL